MFISCPFMNVHLISFYVIHVHLISFMFISHPFVFILCPFQVLSCSSHFFHVHLISFQVLSSPFMFILFPFKSFHFHLISFRFLSFASHCLSCSSPCLVVNLLYSKLYSNWFIKWPHILTQDVEEIIPGRTSLRRKKDKKVSLCGLPCWFIKWPHILTQDVEDIILGRTSLCTKNDIKGVALRPTLLVYKMASHPNTGC